MNNYYRYPNSNYSGSPYFILKAVNNSGISEFHILDNENNEIGTFGDFQSVMNSDTTQKSQYYFSSGEVESFINTLVANNGAIKARVRTTNGDTYIFHYKAVQNNWRITVEQNHPNLNDDFRLINKEKQNEEFNYAII